MKAEYLDYRDLPGQNPIFLRYLYDFKSVAEWYPAGPPDPDLLRRRADGILRGGRVYPREALAASLERFNRAVGAGERALENIERLRGASTVAIVTGQQIGLFGGPALAVHKALTVLSLTRQLAEDGVQAIPVFWLASDDSDYDEIAAARLLREDGGLLSVVHPRPSDNGNRMVGTVPVTGASELFERLESELVWGDFRRVALATLRQAYGEGRSLSHAFGAWMANLFRDHGLVLYDAFSAGMKQYLAEAYQLAIRRRDQIVAVLTQRAEQLRQAELTPQVQVTAEETLLFLCQGTRRFKLTSADGRFQAKDEDARALGPEELLALCRRDPEALGPNVLLRPVLQDLLFPTVAYVAGPAETAYFAQISAIAPLWQDSPAVLPRVGITLVDAKAQRLLSKYRIGIKDVLGATPEQTLRRLARDSAAGDLLRKFEGLEADVEKQAGRIGEDLAPMDAGIAQLLKNSEAKMLYQVRKVRDRFIRNYAQHSSDLARHVNFLHNLLYPEQTLQERVINFNHFLILEGPTLIDRILQSIQPFCKEHQILYVSAS
ncbi:MAG: bacillithiol biosynthesis cysteine-adding enzyme BshC [Acidobacteriota bacterium]